MLNYFVTFESLSGMPYLNQVVMEVLRFRPPVAQSSGIYTTQDTTIGKYNVKAHHTMQINMIGLHFNQNEWQRPYEFIPERFDHENELSLTPNGKKRNPYSWLPFNGGKRICFGKTFADANLKIFALYAIKYFNFELVDKTILQNEFPMLHIAMSHTVPIKLKFTNYQEENLD